MTLQLLTNSIELRQKQTKAINLLQSWIDDEDIEDRQGTGQYLMHALDEERLSERKLFPVEMKGVTWEPSHSVGCRTDGLITNPKLF